MIISKMGKENNLDFILMVSFMTLLISVLIVGAIGGAVNLGSRLPTLTDTFLISCTFLGFTIGMLIPVAISLCLCERKINAFIPLFIYSFLLTTIMLGFQLISTVAFLLLTLAVGEILFGLEKNKPKKNQGRMSFTLERKLENLFEGFLFSGTGLSWYFMVQYFSINLMNGAITIIEWVGTGTVLIVGIYAYIWVNSLKYKKGGRK